MPFLRKLVKFAIPWFARAMGFCTRFHQSRCLKDHEEDCLVFFKYHGHHREIPLQKIYLLSKDFLGICHVQPFLHLLNEMYQAKQNKDITRVMLLIKEHNHIIFSHHEIKCGMKSLLNGARENTQEEYQDAK